MAYKSIFTVLTDNTGCADILDPAIAFAIASGGHLDVLAMAVDRTQASYPAAGIGIALLDIGLAAAIETRDEIDAAARAILDRSDLDWSLESLAAPSVSIPAIIAERARMSDLVILPQPYGDGTGPDAPAVIESVLFRAGAAVLVLPDTRPVPKAPSHVLIAWNESPEALAAIRAAMPVLQAASSVDILVIDPARHGAAAADPGADLARMLSRHGVEVSVAIAAQTLPRISDVITREAQDRGSEMIVMGAYSHSRFREAILGGTTRNLLEAAKLPILMAH